MAEWHSFSVMAAASASGENMAIVAIASGGNQPFSAENDDGENESNGES
jgi:hypothetical protein